MTPLAEKGNTQLPTAKGIRMPFVTNGSYFSYDTGQPACAGLFIKNGKIVKDGTTTGSEVCLDIDGKLFTPQAGISAAKLLKQGVKGCVWYCRSAFNSGGEEDRSGIPT